MWCARADSGARMLCAGERLAGNEVCGIPLRRARPIDIPLYEDPVDVVNA